MIQIVIKKYKFIIGIFLILCIVSVTVWKYIKKENIYILYNNEVSECKQIDKYEKSKYPLCYNGMYLFEKIDKKPIILVDDLKKIKLTSKKDFFKYFNHSNINIYLIIKKVNTYEILPVNIFQVLS